MGSIFACIVFAILALALVKMSDAHGHGLTSWDRNAVIVLSFLSVAAFVYALAVLKKMITS